MIVRLLEFGFIEDCEREVSEMSEVNGALKIEGSNDESIGTLTLLILFNSFKKVIRKKIN